MSSIVEALGEQTPSGAFRVVRQELNGFRQELSELRTFAEQVQKQATAAASPSQAISIVAFSADLDRLLAAMNMATAAAAMGDQVNLFFTFWATCALRKSQAKRKRPLIDRLFGWLLPTGSKDLRLSKMHMGGVGTAMMKQRMKAKNVESLDELFAMAQDAGVHLFVCDVSMDLLGLDLDDLIDYPGLNRCGAVTFLSEAMDSRMTLFI